MTLQTAEIDAENGTVLSTKTLGTRKQPDYYSGNPSFAPDGKKIVYAVGQTSGKKFPFRCLFSILKQMRKRSWQQILQRHNECGVARKMRTKSLSARLKKKTRRLDFCSSNIRPAKPSR